MSLLLNYLYCPINYIGYIDPRSTQDSRRLTPQEVGWDPEPVRLRELIGKRKMYCPWLESNPGPLAQILATIQAYHTFEAKSDGRTVRGASNRFQKSSQACDCTGLAMVWSSIVWIILLEDINENLGQFWQNIHEVCFQITFNRQ
jgi:hypothetical protein